MTLYIEDCYQKKIRASFTENEGKSCVGNTYFDFWKFNRKKEKSRFFKYIVSSALIFFLNLLTLPKTTMYLLKLVKRLKYLQTLTINLGNNSFIQEIDKITYLISVWF